MLQRYVDIHSYNTRNKCNYYLSLFRTDKQKTNCLYNCLKRFNELPNVIKSIENLCLYKKKIVEILDSL